MAEQVQEQAYPDAEVEAHLRTHLPLWTLQGGAICRTYRTHNWKATLMVINAIGHLAEAAWHHPDISASYSSVAVRLSTHSAKGITAKDFELASKIEEMIQWRPKPGSALEGTPNEERYAYISYDT